MEKLIITMKDIKRFEILQQLINKQIKGYQAAYLLGYHPVHVSRLKQKILKYGFKALLRSKGESPSKIPTFLKERITNLYK